MAGCAVLSPVAASGRLGERKVLLVASDNQTDRWATVPNALSVLRLALVPVFVWLMLVAHADGWAFALLVVSGVTDWLDGKLARLLDQQSRVGELLDPLVDRVYMVVTLVTFVARGIIPWWLAVLLVGRDLLLAATLPVYRRRSLPAPEVMYLGKAATFALMAAFPWLLAGQTSWPVADFGWAFGTALLVWGAGVYLWTAILYAGKAIAVARASKPGVAAGRAPG